MNRSADTSRNFRPEIQALRALAVLLVVAYHLEPRIVPGGYIGVDIFLVISGFLITSHLLREAKASGRINLAAFFAGRARRILPASLLVIVVVLGATMALLPKTFWADTGAQALASAFSVQNWLLAADSVDYLAAEKQPGALQHFWSLAVEEQFYLFWPLVILAVCGLVKSAGGFTPQRNVLWWVFGTITLGSLGYSIFTGYSGNAAGYFVTTTRMWELATGGLLALAYDGHAAGKLPLPNWVSSFPVRNIGVLLALAAILYAALGYDGQTVFPGIAAAVPVLACAVVIAAGATGGPGSLHRLAQWAPVQYIGLISYSLYLWHWPLIVFTVQLSGREPRALESLTLLGLSLLLAAASQRWVEEPVRHWKPLSSSAPRALLAAATAVGLVAALAILPGMGQRHLVQDEQRAAAELFSDPPAGFGAAAIPAGAPALLPGLGQVVPIPAAADADQPQIGDCVQSPQSTTSKECEFGSATATFTLALVGDSHAAHWFEAVETLANQKGWKLVTYLKNSCPFSATARSAETSGAINCSEANGEALERILSRGDINAVITSNWAGAGFARDADPAKGFAAHWTRLEEAGIDVYPIVDTPRPDIDGYARDCVEEHLGQLEQCQVDRLDAFEKNDLIRRASSLEPRVTALDFSDQFCTSEYCPAVIGNVLVYRDKHHISDTYMKTLAPVFGQRLQLAMDENL